MMKKNAGKIFALFMSGFLIVTSGCGASDAEPESEMKETTEENIGENHAPEGNGTEADEGTPDEEASAENDSAENNSAEETSGDDVALSPETTPAQEEIPSDRKSVV